MNVVQSLEKRVREKFPDVGALITPPMRDDAAWRLDLTKGKCSVVVEAHPCGRIDISFRKSVWADRDGQRADGIVLAEDKAFEVIAALLDGC